MISRYRISRRTRRVSCLLLLATSSFPAYAAEQAAEPPPLPGPSDIIVVGNPDLFRDVVPERRLDGEAIGGYGLGTVAGLLAEIREELGDDDDTPVLLINGERVRDLGDVASYPAEAIERLDVLPPGSASRVGGAPGRRVYSVVLRRLVRSTTVTVAPRFATEGNWGALRGEAIFTRIQDQNRLNLALRAWHEDALLERDRDIVQPFTGVPFAIRGNIVADPRFGGDEIDPLLSALAGSPISVAGSPSGSNPALGDFAARANRPNITDVGDFRTLRPRTRRYELDLTHSTRLAPWLRSSLSGKLQYSERNSLRGLTSGVFVLPASNPFSPFSRDVGIASYGDPLEQKFSSLRASLNAGLNATLGEWRVNLTGRHQETETDFSTQRHSRDVSSGSILLEDTRNPFSSGLGDLLPTLPDQSSSHARETVLQVDALGSPLLLPAGPVQVAVESRLGLYGLTAKTAFGAERTRGRFRRTELALRGSLEVPIASRRNNFLSTLGELSANFEYSISDFSDVTPLLHHYGFGLVWSPQEWIHVQASINEVRRAPIMELLGEPLTITPGVRMYDFLRGQEVDVSEISGGSPFLAPERVITRRLTAQVRPLRTPTLQLNAEYRGDEVRDLISGLPTESAAFFLAFPERFIRTSDGQLLTVDVRPGNFSRYRQDRLRYGASINIPLGRSALGGAVRSAELPVTEGEDTVPAIASGRGARLQLSLHHGIVFTNEILIRPGLEPVDLLEGGAIGIAGGRPRHQLDLTAGVSSRGIGARLNGTWRGQSLLEIRSGNSVEMLRFTPLATLNLRAFAEGRRLFPQTRWIRGTRFTLSVTNLTNQRQRVTDTAGVTPLRYQPGYRDPLGRTIEFEIRRVF
jgi:iron complex outermembrane recepter protein